MKIQKYLFLVFLLTFPQYSISNNATFGLIKCVKNAMYKTPLYAGWHSTKEEKAVAEEEIKHLRHEKALLKIKLYDQECTSQEKIEIFSQIAQINKSIDKNLVILGNKWSSTRSSAWKLTKILSAVTLTTLSVFCIKNIKQLIANNDIQISTIATLQNQQILAQNNLLQQQILAQTQQQKKDVEYQIKLFELQTQLEQKQSIAKRDKEILEEKMEENRKRAEEKLKQKDDRYKAQTASLKKITEDLEKERNILRDTLSELRLTQMARDKEQAEASFQKRQVSLEKSVVSSLQKQLQEERDRVSKYIEEYMTYVKTQKEIYHATLEKARNFNDVMSSSVIKGLLATYNEGHAEYKKTLSAYKKELQDKNAEKSLEEKDIQVLYAKKLQDSEENIYKLFIDNQKMMHGFVKIGQMAARKFLQHSQDIIFESAEEYQNQLRREQKSSQVEEVTDEDLGIPMLSY